MARHDFLQALPEVCPKPGWPVPAYGLRSNHDHLVVETPDVNLPRHRRLKLTSCCC